MNRAEIILIYTLLFFTSCNEKQTRTGYEQFLQQDSLSTKEYIEPSLTKNTHLTEINNSDNSSIGQDSIPSFVTDDYPITNSMLKSAKFIDNPVLSFDGLWFSNRNQTIAFALYTDYYRYAIFHFENGNVPLDLIDQIELFKPLPESDTADINIKKELFARVFPKINVVDSSYFRTNKGFQLGDSKLKALRVYGQPDIQKNENGVEMLYWEFIGDILYDGKQDSKEKPLARNSFGHEIKMYFKNEKLVALFLKNTIP
ncbi:MAG: hypothetical protein OEW75_03865 [Cyclobacteriaceae bacterium]|nr:hypothetical protein [Cyclobacteriaceae bacterium]